MMPVGGVRVRAGGGLREGVGGGQLEEGRDQRGARGGVPGALPIGKFINKLNTLKFIFEI